MPVPSLRKVFFLSLSLVCWQTMAFGQEIDYKGLPQWSWHKEDSTEYYLYTPSGMKPHVRYPVVLAMHGCCGEDYHATLRNAVDPIVRMWHAFGANKQQIPTYIIAPKTSRGWKQHFGNLKKVMDDLIAHQQGDPQRIYVCGFSMGGEGTWEIIQKYPGYFAAAIPMAMRFRGDYSKVKDIPIWANQGETDWFSRSLRKNIADIRHLNGFLTDTGAVWVTGVNPRYSNFRGVGHGVQWIAASTNDLTGWAYSKINDGNKYPVVFFNTPLYKAAADEGKPVPVDITATDPDGSIARVNVYLNKKLLHSFTRAPFRFSILPAKGDNLLEATAFDNKGKSSTATTIVKVNIPASIITARLPAGNAGSYYETKLQAKGNGHILFSFQDLKTVPPGIFLRPDGTLSGMPEKAGSYTVRLKAADEDNDTTLRSYALTIHPKLPGRVLVTDAITREGTRYRISVMKAGRPANFDSKDSLSGTYSEEINFNDPAPYNGLTYIITDINDANKNEDGFLSFAIDEDAIIYVAYEKLDNLFHSGVPAWLGSFSKEKGEIVAQYRYFDVYSKRFPKGKVVLPAADAKANKVGMNYFVMIKKAS